MASTPGDVSRCSGSALTLMQIRTAYCAGEDFHLTCRDAVKARCPTLALISVSTYSTTAHYAQLNSTGPPKRSRFYGLRLISKEASRKPQPASCSCSGHVPPPKGWAGSRGKESRQKGWQSSLHFQFYHVKFSCCMKPCNFFKIFLNYFVFSISLRFLRLLIIYA